MSNPTIETSSLAPKNISDVLSPSSAQLRGPRMAHFAERPFPRLFEDQATKEPDKTAVFCDRETLTFGELNARANKLARHLRSLGVGRESLVGICIDRSLEMAIGILGILKAGGAYLPLDPEYPTERLDLMLADAQPTLLLRDQVSKKDSPESLRAKIIPLSCWERGTSGGLFCSIMTGLRFQENPARICLMDHRRMIWLM